MLPQVLDKLVSNFKKDMVAVDNFVAENQPEPPKLQSRDDFLKFWSTKLMKLIHIYINYIKSLYTCIMMMYKKLFCKLS